jgi:RNase P subunit RPR2
MNREANKLQGSGVVCLFCGRSTPLPEAAEPRTSEERRVVIIRCRVCGKEAPYQADEIVDLQDETAVGAVTAVGARARAARAR